MLLYRPVYSQVSRCFTSNRAEAKFDRTEIRDTVSFRGHFPPDGSKIPQKTGR